MGRRPDGESVFTAGLSLPPADYPTDEPLGPLQAQRPPCATQGASAKPAVHAPQMQRMDGPVSDANT